MAKKKPTAVATPIRVVFAPAVDTPAAQIVINTSGIVIERDGDSIVNTIVVDHSGDFDDVRSDQLKALREYMRSSGNRFDVDGDLPYRLYAYLTDNLSNDATGVVDANDVDDELAHVQEYVIDESTEDVVDDQVEPPVVTEETTEIIDGP